MRRHVYEKFDLLREMHASACLKTNPLRGMHALVCLQKI